jgi:hypothetical protein
MQEMLVSTIDSPLILDQGMKFLFESFLGDHRIGCKILVTLGLLVLYSLTALFANYIFKMLQVDH